MICNLSAPQGNSVNDFIDPSLCSVHYTSFDTTISMVQKLGPGALLGKKRHNECFQTTSDSTRRFFIARLLF